MYHDEIHHLGRPHFHAIYGEFEASIDIETRGSLPAGFHGEHDASWVEWAAAHQSELRDNWARARGHQPLVAIEPLS